MYMDRTMDRTHGYIWGDRRPVTAASESDPVDLVSLPRFPWPVPIRIDLVGPFPGSAVNVEFRAFIGQGGGSIEERVLTWNRATGRGQHVLYASSLRVACKFLSGAPVPAGTTATAWATLAESSGIDLSRPKPFGTLPTSASFPQAVAGTQLAPAQEFRRRTVANYQGAGTARLLLAMGRAATALDFDYIVGPNSTHIEEADEQFVHGIWDAAGAGFARVSTWSD